MFQREEMRLQGMANDVAAGRIVQIDAAVLHELHSHHP